MERIIAKIPRPSPNTWLAIATIATFALSVAAGWALVGQIRLENARHERERLLGEIVGVLRQGGLANARTVTRDLAANAAGFLAGDSSRAPTLLARMDGVMRISGADMAFLLDSNGVVKMRIQSPAETDILGKDLAFRRYHQKARLGQEDEFAALGVYTHTRGIYSSTPVRGPDGRFLGVAVCRLPAGRIESEWLSRLSDPTALVSPEGVVIASNLADWRLKSVLPSDTAIRRILSTRQFGDSLSPLPLDLRKDDLAWDGSRRIAVRAALPDGWTLVSLLDRSARLPLTRSQFGAAFGLGAAWCLLAILGVVAAASMSRIRRGESDRNRLTKRLEEAERLESLGRLAGGVAHDFNNVLTAIVGYASVLEYKLPAESTEKDLARRVGLAAKRASETVRQLMAFARRSGLQAKPIPFHDLLAELVGNLSRTFPTNIELRLEPRAERDIVIADSNHLHQSILNLCQNARDAMPEGGRILMTTSLVETGAGKILEFRLSDTGRGIPPEALPHIFEPFYTNKQGGRVTGLGLASVWGIIQRHGGNIAVESTPGKGTEFRIRLPLAPPGVEAERNGIGFAGAGAGRRLRVVALDDDPDVLQVIRTMVDSLGHEIEVFSEFARMWEWMKEQASVDLVVLDVEMPGTSGFEAIRRIRVTYPDIPIMIASGRLSSTTIDELKQLGIETFLRKPFGAQEIGISIGKAVGRKP